MRRRQFLSSASAIAGFAAMPIAGSVAAHQVDVRFTLLRTDDPSAGATFLPQSLAPCVLCSAPVLQVSIDGLYPADDGAVLEDIAIHAMFDLPEGGSVPFVAWRHAAGAVPSRTDRARFIANRATLRRFELEYRIAGSASRQRETCPLTRSDAPLLAPGHYLLLGPRRDGSPADPSGLVHSGDVTAPLQVRSRRNFDYLAIRIDAAT